MHTSNRLIALSSLFCVALVTGCQGTATDADATLRDVGVPRDGDRADARLDGARLDGHASFDATYADGAPIVDVGLDPFDGAPRLDGAAFPDGSPLDGGAMDGATTLDAARFRDGALEAGPDAAPDAMLDGAVFEDVSSSSDASAPGDVGTIGLDGDLEIPCGSGVCPGGTFCCPSTGMCVPFGCGECCIMGPPPPPPPPSF